MVVVDIVVVTKMMVMKGRGPNSIYTDCRSAALAAITCIIMLPLFKCFLEWEEDKVWWKKLGNAF